MYKIHSHLVGSSDLNQYGKLYGGKVLSLIDSAGWQYVIDSIRPKGNVVTRKFDNCLFEAPANLGEWLDVYGEITYMGNTSITVSLKCYVKERLIVSTSVVYVHLVDGKPSKVLNPEKIK
jgi:acyl-CoA thioesterase YciA